MEFCCLFYGFFLSIRIAITANPIMTIANRAAMDETKYCSTMLGCPMGVGEGVVAACSTMNDDSALLG
jgi:hypothetical protein